VTANLQTIAYVHQGVLEALVAKLASLGLVDRRELVELLDRVERHVQPQVANQALARQAFDDLRAAASAQV
jgi:hypothetical protein